MKKGIALGIITFICLFLTMGCSSSLLTKDSSTDIFLEKDHAEQLEIDLDVGYGQIDVSTGDNAWIDGEVNYNISNLKPEVSYKLKGEKGKATVSQEKAKIRNGKIKNNWDLQLTNEIPVDLKVSTGAADTNLNLQGMQLSKLGIESGVGRTKVDLSGEWQEDFDVHIEMGVGQSTIILPKDVGVKIKSTKGIGTSNFEGFISTEENVYVNEAFETADTIITVHAELGVGEANFELEK